MAPSTPLFGDLRLPLICAPMFLVSYPELIVAACKANIAAACSASTARSSAEYAEWLDQFDEQLAAYRKATGKKTGPYAANLSLRAGKVGASRRFEEDILTCKTRKIPLLITINGSPDEIVQEVHGWGGMIFHDVTTVRHAEKAAKAGVDGMILITGGGGGHSGALNPFVFVSAVRRFFDGVIVLAGGITTGRHIRAAEILGADLCYMGTRFIASEEARVPQEYKDMIVAARAEDLIFTPHFTHGIPANLLKASVRRAGYDPVQLSRPDPAPPSENVKPWRDIWAAGQGVELIADSPPVEQLVSQMEKEYREARSR